MKRIYLLFIATAIGSSSIFAQQDPQFTQFMYDRLSFNPGFAGSQEAICATVFGRQQWSGFSGQPNTGLLNVSAPIKSIKSGVGLSVYLDEIGPQSTTALRLSYAYHLKISGATKLGIGLSVGLLNSSLNNDWIAYNYSSDGVNTGIGTGAGDNLIPQNNQTASTFDAAFGLYLYNPKYYAGISMGHLNEGDLSDMNITVARHLYFMAGYHFDLDARWRITPNVLVKSDLASTQLDANATVMYDNTFWLGATYRLEDAIAPMAGYQYEFPSGNSTLRIGYSYDFTTSEINNYSSGSHELMLSYCLKIAKPLPKRVYKNPRFL
ncbi:MAG: type IX secretion system membrane protein PorP/SprF [Cryomorphaceae bacterium]|nr:type IX secretion system membrane protein PorP/SprF [Flavobacteriales bacterium]